MGDHAFAFLGLILGGMSGLRRLIGAACHFMHGGVHFVHGGGDLIGLRLLPADTVAGFFGDGGGLLRGRCQLRGCAGELMNGLAEALGHPVEAGCDVTEFVLALVADPGGEFTVGKPGGRLIDFPDGARDAPYGCQGKQRIGADAHDEQDNGEGAQGLVLADRMPVGFPGILQLRFDDRLGRSAGRGVNGVDFLQYHPVRFRVAPGLEQLHRRLNPLTYIGVQHLGELGRLCFRGCVLSRYRLGVVFPACLRLADGIRHGVGMHGQRVVVHGCECRNRIVLQAEQHLGARCLHVFEYVAQFAGGDQSLLIEPYQMFFSFAHGTDAEGADDDQEHAERRRE